MDEWPAIPAGNLEATFQIYRKSPLHRYVAKAAIQISSYSSSHRAPVRTFLDSLISAYEDIPEWVKNQRIHNQRHYFSLIHGLGNQVHCCHSGWKAIQDGWFRTRELEVRSTQFARALAESARRRDCTAYHANSVQST
ncbi:hypothetical protein NQZ79_g1610 [Umbelopsis isabellina]|nr:hypothetical protein NQZ79_g1610 [Umbelopsis isabellina]